MLSFVCRLEMYISFVQSFMVYTSVCYGCKEGEIRLSNGLDSGSGRVEVCRDGEWGTVCFQDWDDNDALVVCRELGLPTNGM